MACQERIDHRCALAEAHQGNIRLVATFFSNDVSQFFGQRFLALLARKIVTTYVAGGGLRQMIPGVPAPGESDGRSQTDDEVITRKAFSEWEKIVFICAITVQDKKNSRFRLGSDFR
jgi:hypothetical protein